MKHSSALLYLRACYQADNREQTVLDLFGSKVRFLSFFERTAEILSDELPSRRVVDEAVAEAGRTARLHRTEKELLFTTLFVVGRVPQGEAQQRLCAPLFSYPVTVDEDAESRLWLHVDTSARRLNVPLLDVLASAYSLDPVSGAPTQIGAPLVFSGNGMPRAIAVDGSGRFAFVSNRVGSVEAFGIDPVTGELDYRGTTPSGGQAPEAIAVDPWAVRSSIAACSTSSRAASVGLSTLRTLPA